MGYIRVGETESPLGEFGKASVPALTGWVGEIGQASVSALAGWMGEIGCTPGCGCRPCRSVRSALGEWYVRDDDEPEPEPRRVPDRPAPATERLAGQRRGATLGEPQSNPPSPMVPQAPTIQIRPVQNKPAAILDRFEFRSPALRSSIHQSAINLLARQVAASWQTASPIRTIHLVGHTDSVGPSDFNLQLGQQRALAVRQALMPALDQLRPGLSGRVTSVLKSLGETRPRFDNRAPEGRSRNRRVEVFFSTVPASGPLPKAPASRPPSLRPVRIPSPAEAAQKIIPIRTETPDERLQRMLKTPPPSPLARRSFDQMFWAKVNERLDSTMNRAGVPPALRGPIRDAARAAIERGADSVLDHALDRANLNSRTKEAIKTTVRALGTVPLR